MYVIATGNPFDGLALYGPFEDANGAGDWASDNFDEWTCVSMSAVSSMTVGDTTKALDV